MTALSIIWTLILLDLAALHAAWAARIWWPLGDEDALAGAVVGVYGVHRMPGPVPCALVAVLLGALALLPWWDTFPQPAFAFHAAGILLAIRGLASWTDAWARLTPREPFRRLDQFAYGPLCIALSVMAHLLGGAHA